VRSAQQTQMFRDGRPRYRKNPCDLPRGLNALPQKIKHSSSGRIG
jgi:hypothetical protein